MSYYAVQSTLFSFLRSDGITLTLFFFSFFTIMWMNKMDDSLQCNIVSQLVRFDRPSLRNKWHLHTLLWIRQHRWIDRHPCRLSSPSFVVVHSLFLMLIVFVAPNSFALSRAWSDTSMAICCNPMTHDKPNPPSNGERGVNVAGYPGAVGRLGWGGWWWSMVMMPLPLC